MNNPLSGNVSKWVFAIGIIVALLIPTSILFSQQLDVSESETTSVKIHNYLFIEAYTCQMDIEHEIAKEDRWYRGGFYIPHGDERYLVLTYYIDFDQEILKAVFLGEQSLEVYNGWYTFKESGIQVIVPYMPSGGDIGIDYVNIEIDENKNAIITVVALFSAPEDKPWYVSNVKVILSNLLFLFIITDEPPIFLTATVSIEHEVVEEWQPPT